MIEHKVGAIIEDNGVKYRAVKDLPCDKCDISRDCDKTVDVFGYCYNGDRSDNQHIGWKKLMTNFESVTRDKEALITFVRSIVSCSSCPLRGACDSVCGRMWERWMDKEAGK